MRLYVESSAILAVMFAEPAAEQMRGLMAAADLLLTSELTLIECDRALHRAAALKKFTESEVARRRAVLAQTTAAWTILKIADEIIARARQPFPAEPIRTLDAIHLASALVARSGATGMELLSLDDRIRAAAKSLGLPLQPV